MRTGTMHPQPSRAAMWTEELRAVGLSMRRELLIGAALLAGVTLVLWLVYFALPLEGRSEMGIRFGPDIATPLSMVALFLPLFVWRKEDPERRGYLWSLPCERGSLHLAKGLSGWAWMIGAVVAVLLWLTAITWMFPGEGAGMYEHVHVDRVGPIATPAGAVERVLVQPGPGEIYRLTVPIPAWQWLVPFAAVSVAYLFGSIVAIGSKHPFAWGLGVWAGMIGLGILTSDRRLGVAHRVATEILYGRFGFATGMTGGHPRSATLTNELGGTIESIRRLPDLVGWLGSVALWGIPVVAGFLLVTRRYREG